MYNYISQKYFMQCFSPFSPSATTFLEILYLFCIVEEVCLQSMPDLGKYAFACLPPFLFYSIIDPLLLFLVCICTTELYMYTSMDIYMNMDQYHASSTTLTTTTSNPTISFYIKYIRFPYISIINRQMGKTRTTTVVSIPISIIISISWLCTTCQYTRVIFHSQYMPCSWKMTISYKYFFILFKVNNCNNIQMSHLFVD